jgi:hypothetical protein
VGWGSWGPWLLVQGSVPCPAQALEPSTSSSTSQNCHRLGLQYRISQPSPNHAKGLSLTPRSERGGHSSERLRTGLSSCSLWFICQLQSKFTPTRVQSLGSFSEDPWDRDPLAWGTQPYPAGSWLEVAWTNSSTCGGQISLAGHLPGTGITPQS